MEKDNIVVEDGSEKKNVRGRKTTVNKTKEKTIDDLRPNDRTEVRNLRAWDLSFIPKDGNIDEITRGLLIKENAKVMLKISEIEDQVNNGNELFCGIDGMGNHAPLYIADPLVRELVFGNQDQPKQLTLDEINNLFVAETKNAFKAQLSELVVTNSEKRMLLHICSNKELYPSVNIDEAMSFMLNEIEKHVGASIK